MGFVIYILIEFNPLSVFGQYTYIAQTTFQRKITHNQIYSLQKFLILLLADKVLCPQHISDLTCRKTYTTYVIV